MARAAREKDSSNRGKVSGEKKSLRTIEIEMVDILVYRFKTEMPTISNQLPYQFALGVKFLNFESF